MNSASIRHHQAEALGAGEQLLEARALTSQDDIDQADFGIDQIEHGVLLAEQLLLRGFGCDKNKPKRERDEPNALLLLEDDAIVDRIPIEHKSDQHTLTRHDIAQAGFHFNDDVHWIQDAWGMGCALPSKPASTGKALRDTGEHTSNYSKIRTTRKKPKIRASYPHRPKKLARHDFTVRS